MRDNTGVEKIGCELTQGINRYLGLQVTTSYETKQVTYDNYKDAPLAELAELGAYPSARAAGHGWSIPINHKVMSYAVPCWSCDKTTLTYSGATRRLADLTYYLRQSFKYICTCGGPIWEPRVAAILTVIAEFSEDNVARYLTKYINQRKVALCKQ